MSTKERIDYIWEYYKLPIILTLCSIFFIGYIVSSFLKEEEPFLNIMVVDHAQSQELNSLLSKINEETPDQKFQADYIMYSSENISSDSYAQVQKMFAHLSTGSVDMMIVDQELFDQLMDQKAFSPINNGNEELYGVKISDMERFSEIPTYQDKLIGIPVNSQNRDYMIQFVEDNLKK
ncbi:hypothetical protein ACFSYB_06865 [Litchfieldia salsa]